MELQQVMDELRTLKRGHFPAVAVHEAVARREEVTPLLLAELERVADNPDLLGKNDGYMLPMYALYLLAQFREPRAWPVILRLFGQATPKNKLVDNVGDFVTEDLDATLACVYNGDLAPMKQIIADKNCEPYVRGACLRAMSTMAVYDWLPLTELETYFAELLAGGLERKGDIETVWSSIASAACDLRLMNLESAIARAFDDGLIDPFNIRKNEFLGDIRLPLEMEELRQLRDYHIITDIVEEMHYWPCFQKHQEFPKSKKSPKAAIPSFKPKLPLRPTEPPPPPPPATPITRDAPKTGRNDPCPCGSGKKYKKCCGS